MPGVFEVIVFIFIISVLIVVFRKYNNNKRNYFNITSDLNKKGYSLRRINGSWSVYLGTSRVYLSQNIDNIKSWAGDTNALTKVKRCVKRKGYVLKSKDTDAWLVYDENLDLVLENKEIGEIYNWCQRKPNAILEKDSLKLNKYELRISEDVAKNDHTLGKLDDMWVLSPNNESNNEKLYFHTINEVQSWILSLTGSASAPTNTNVQADVNNKVVEEISAAASNFIDMQLFMYKDENNTMPSEMIDNWSIGYVAGVVDYLLYSKNIGNNTITGAQTMVNVFSTTLGNGELFGKFMEIQSDSKTTEGMQTGGDEVMKFIENSSNIPRQLSEHI